MGEMDDGFDGPELMKVEFLVLYQGGHSDGYTHFHSGPLYESPDAAEFSSKKLHGNHAVEPKAISCARIDGRVYIIEGPYKTFGDLELEEEIRLSALNKLTAAEKKVLGLK